jgi:hypothetical protein
MCIFTVIKISILLTARNNFSRSQWPRGLRHEPSAPDRTLGSWVRILFETWMSVCVYSVCFVYVGNGLATG